MLHGNPRKTLSSSSNRVFFPSARVVSLPFTNNKGGINQWGGTSTDGLQLKNILEGPPSDSFLSALQMKAKYPLHFG
eukprot:13663486-Ditylum_brightwellii.AAC.1